MRISLCTALVCLVLTNAFGQTVLKTPGGTTVQLPSDSELKAHYCLAVVKSWLRTDDEQIQTGEFNLKQEADPVKKSQWTQFLQISRDGRADDADIFNRLQSFINPKLTYLEPRALSSAYKRGETDVIANANSGISEQCTAKCKNPGGNTYMACAKSCLEADPLWRRVVQCRSLEFLPF